MTAPVKFSPSERDRRPPVEWIKTEELISERDPLTDGAMDEDDGLIGADNPPMRSALQATRPRRR